MIPRGELNAIITIQEDQGTTQSASGQPVEDWQALHTSVWCKWEPKVGDEEFMSNQKTGKQMVIVTMDYLSNVTAKERVLKDSVIYRIAGEPEYKEYRGLCDPDTMVLKLVRFDNE